MSFELSIGTAPPGGLQAGDKLPISRVVSGTPTGFALDASSLASVGSVTPSPAAAVAAIGTATTAAHSDHVHSSQVPNWTTGTRPGSPATGLVGFATDTSRFEFWNGTAWNQHVRLSDVPVGSAGQLYGPTGTAGVLQALSLGTNLSVTGTTLNAALSGGSTYSGGCLYIDGTLTSGTAGSLPRIDVFTASGTWTKQSGVTRVVGRLIGGGGGGGSGCYVASGTLASGGAGGGGGYLSPVDMFASSLGATSTVTIGATGPGGTAPAAGATTGNTGTTGGTTSITTAGNPILAYGGLGGSGGRNAANATPGSGGGPYGTGNANGGTSPVSPPALPTSGATGAYGTNGVAGTQGNMSGGSPGGASGGGLAATPVNTIGGTGGHSIAAQGGAPGAAGANGSAASTPLLDYGPGASGAGGGGNATAAAGAPGAGSGYGAGGAGAGATGLNTAAIPAGADGRPGVVVLMQA